MPGLTSFPDSARGEEFGQIGEGGTANLNPHFSRKLTSPRPRVVYSSYSVFDGLEEIYSFREREQVRSFVAANSYLIELLVEAAIKIKGYFPDAALALEVIKESETEEAGHLTVFIVTALEADQAFDCYERLGQEWWLKVIREMPREWRGKMNINLEFR